MSSSSQSGSPGRVPRLRALRIRGVARIVTVMALWLLSACGPRYIAPAPPPAGAPVSARVPDPSPAPAPDPAPAATRAPAPAPPVAEEHAAAVAPVPAAPAPAAPRPAAVDADRDAGSDVGVTAEPPEVAILFDSSSPDYAQVAAQLGRLLTPRHYRLTATDISADSSQAALRELRQRTGTFLVTIGLPAARMARDQLAGPILFAQVFNYHELLSDTRPVRGVATIPPLALQLKDWRGFDPDLRRVGLIAGERHADLVREAERAAESAGISLRHEVSTSDQETLYLFRRLAPQIDGFWLVPDDRILSPGVLREMLDYASTHGIQVSTFNDALLEWGAMQSATSTAADVARTLDRVLGEMVGGKIAEVPLLTPLSELEIRVNREVAGELGVTPPPGATRLVR